LLKISKEDFHQNLPGYSQWNPIWIQLFLVHPKLRFYGNLM
jgi:hypothetical protein